MKYLYQGLRTTLTSIKKHKFVFIVLIILQLAFLVSISAVALSYQVKILNNIQGIADPLGEANYDPEQVQTGQPFTENLLAVYQNYNSLTKNMRQGSMLILLLFLVGNGLLWVLSHWMVYGVNFRKIGNIWLKFLASWAVVYIPASIVVYFLLRSLLTSQVAVDSFSSTLKVLFYVFLSVYYFVLVGFAFIPAHSWKQFFRAVKWCGFQKIIQSISVLVVVVGLIVGSLYLVFLTMDAELSFFWLALTSVIVLIVICVMRLFWISALREIYEGNTRH